MPANLTPQYMELEKKLKTARMAREKLEILEEMLAVIPKHKGTEKMQAMLKTKIAKLREAGDKKPGAARYVSPYLIDRSGAGQIVVAGLPNSGKSSLIKALTGANPEIGDYPFTTKLPAPYMMKFENVRIQLIDTPPLMTDFIDTGLAEAVKVSDGVLLVADLASEDPASDLEAVLLQFRERKVELQGIEQPLPEQVPPYRKRSLVAACKSDAPREENLETLRVLFGDRLDVLAVSPVSGQGLEEARKCLFRLLRVVRVYSKAPGKKPDLDEPFTLRRGSTVTDMAQAVHKDFAQNLKYARIWRTDKLQGQMANREQVLEDGDVIELHM
ncbi:MAG: 50S ribosome-binding GTPase [Candidatus Aminicenantes bacterium]|nr:50S ribosome-binding GTPase [Candidatus Aminicenantes bacterium]